MFVIDTNVYVRAANEADFARRLEEFLRRHGPIPVSSVVLSEILIGVRDSVRHPALVQALTVGTEILTPTADDWIAAGRVLSQAGGEDVTKRRSFWNDTIIAAQCARLGLTLVTANVSDFRRLSRHLGLSVGPPFPE